MKNWLAKLVGQLRRDQAGLVLLNLSVNRQTKRQPELRLPPDLEPTSKFVWTREEAEAAWKMKRTEVNLAIMLPENTSRSIQCAAGNFMVDGSPARVEVCVNEAAKRWILTPPEKRLEQKRKQERLEREQEREQDRLERQKWAKFPPDPEPVEGRTCRVCGGKLVLVLLNYFCDGETDVITPADKAEKCLSCGRSFVIEFC